MILFDTSTRFMIMKIFIEVVLLEAVSIELNAPICLLIYFNDYFYVWTLAFSMAIRSLVDDDDENLPHNDDDDVRLRVWRYDFIVLLLDECDIADNNYCCYVYNSLH
jgi:hypothetical protein